MCRPFRLVVLRLYSIGSHRYLSLSLAKRIAPALPGFAWVTIEVCRVLLRRGGGESGAGRKDGFL